MEKFKFLEHTADVKFQAFGKTLSEAFENSALALKEIICGNIKIKNKIKKGFVIEASNKDLDDGDKEALMYRFLEEFLYLLDAEDFLFNKIKLKFFQKSRLEVDVWGDKASNYKITNSVKAVTYNDMFIKKEKNKFIVQVVLDV